MLYYQLLFLLHRLSSVPTLYICPYSPVIVYFPPFFEFWKKSLQSKEAAEGCTKMSCVKISLLAKIAFSSPSFSF